MSTQSSENQAVNTLLYNNRVPASSLNPINSSSALSLPMASLSQQQIRITTLNGGVASATPQIAPANGAFPLANSTTTITPRLLAVEKRALPLISGSAAAGGGAISPAVTPPIVGGGGAAATVAANQSIISSYNRPTAVRLVQVAAAPHHHSPSSSSSTVGGGAAGGGSASNFGQSNFSALGSPITSLSVGGVSGLGGAQTATSSAENLLLKITDELVNANQNLQSEPFALSASSAASSFSSSSSGITYSTSSSITSGGGTSSRFHTLQIASCGVARGLPTLAPLPPSLPLTHTHTPAAGGGVVGLATLSSPPQPPPSHSFLSPNSSSSVVSLSTSSSSSLTSSACVALPSQSAAAVLTPPNSPASSSLSVHGASASGCSVASAASSSAASQLHHIPAAGAPPPHSFDAKSLLRILSKETLIRLESHFGLEKTASASGEGGEGDATNHMEQLANRIICKMSEPPTQSSNEILEAFAKKLIS